MTAPTTTLGVFAGVVSDVGLVSGALTDAELNELSSSPPVVSTADVGWYRAASKVSLRRYMGLHEGDFTSVPFRPKEYALFARSGEKRAAAYRFAALREDAKRGLSASTYKAAAAMRAVLGKAAH